MELNVIEQGKKRLIFELKGADHTFCNALKEELWNDKNIDAAGYNVDHPLIGIPRFVVETKGSSPKEALNSAVNRLRKVSEKFKKEFQRELK